MPEIRYQNRVVGFVDILGFKNLIRSPEKLQDVYDSFLMISGMRLSVWSLEDALRYPNEDHFPNIPKGSAELSLFSDNFLMSVSEDNSEAILALMISVSCLQNMLLSSKGILCRGAIHAGELMHGESPHKGNIVFGPAVTEAYQIEQAVTSYPRVVLSERFLLVLRRHDLFHLCRNQHLIVQDFDGLYFINYGLFSFGIHRDPEHGVHEFELSFDAQAWAKERIWKSLEELGGDASVDPQSHMNMKSKWMWLATRFNINLEELKRTDPPKADDPELAPIDFLCQL
jgi:hypothetical protein